MTTPSETLLSEFIDAWNAGERPDADAYLARADESGRDALEREIHTFLLHAPTPAYSDAARAAIAADPLVRAIAEIPGRAIVWPTLLPALRGRAQLLRDELVTRLAAALEVAGSERKVARYYHQMETGALDPAGVSASVLDALAALLGVSARELDEAGRLTEIVSPQPQGAFGRAYREDAAADLEFPASVPASAGAAGGGDERPAVDRVDELFCGGR